MRRLMLAGGASVVVVMCFSAAPLYAQGYADPPAVLAEQARRAAEAILFALANNDPSPEDGVSQVWPDLVLYTVADAVGTATTGPGIRSVPPYHYWGESARTDKQVGATAGSSGSTTLNERPGIPTFVALALEHGAIEREISGTSVTLTTSPYSLIKLWEPDTQENFRKYSFWRRWGFSATTNLTQVDAADAGDPDPQELSEWSVRVRVLGDRSTRGKPYLRLWDDRVGSLIQKRLNTLTRGFKDVLDEKQLKPASDSLRRRLRGEIATYLAGSTSTPTEERAEHIQSMILSALRAGIFDEIRAGGLSIPREVRDTVNMSLVPSLRATHKELSGVQELVDEMVQEVNRSTLLTLAYTHHRSSTGSDYSDTKLLFETYVAPVTVVMNAGLELYHEPNRALGQSTVRDFGAGITLEGAWKSFLTRPGDRADMSQVTLSASARVFRMEEIDDYVWLAQAKLEIPMVPGVNVPIALTYASRTELVDESEVRGNFGISLDFDKLYARARTGSAP